MAKMANTLAVNLNKELQTTGYKFTLILHDKEEWSYVTNAPPPETLTAITNLLKLWEAEVKSGRPN